MGVLLALVHTALGLVWFSAIILGTGFASRWLKGERATKVVDRFAGGVIIGFGATLALQQR